MDMQSNAWMTKWLFESWISHFIECLRKGPGIDLSNRHLLFLDRHNCYVTLEVVRVAMESELHIISHMNHAFQSLTSRKIVFSAKGHVSKDMSLWIAVSQ